MNRTTQMLAYRGIRALCWIQLLGRINSPYPDEKILYIFVIVFLMTMSLFNNSTSGIFGIALSNTIFCFWIHWHHFAFNDHDWYYPAPSRQWTLTNTITWYGGVFRNLNHRGSFRLSRTMIRGVLASKTPTRGFRLSCPPTHPLLIIFSHILTINRLNSKYTDWNKIRSDKVCWL